jgi:chromosome segregation ATPase
LAQRELELLALSEEEAALMKMIWAAEDANRVRSLEIELLNTQGRSWEATLAQRELELLALSKEEAALMKMIWAAEDANRVRDLEIDLLNELGRSTEATAISRQMELLALSEAEAALMKLIWALQDAKQAAEDAYSALERSVQAQKDLIEDEYQSLREQTEASFTAQMEAIEQLHEAQMEALDEQMEAAQEHLSEISSIVSTLDSAVKQLRNQVDELAKYAYFDAQRLVRDWARAGALPGSEEIEAATTALTGDTAQYYTSSADYRKDQLYNLASLEALLDTAEKQKTDAEAIIEQLELQREALQEQYEAEQKALQEWRDAEFEAQDAWRDAQIEALDLILENARAELDALLGIDQTLLSVDDAVAQFNASIEVLREAQNAANDYLDPTLQYQMQSLEWLSKIHEAVSWDSTESSAREQAEQSNENTAALLEEVAMLRAAMTALLEENTRQSRSSADTLKKWDYDGLPAAREDTTLEII